MRCLLVDDEPGIREGMAMLLRRRGCEVRTAGSCADASRLLSDERFDVVVSDWRLPDGEASVYLVDCDTPVIAVSGHPEEVIATAAIRQVLQKPISPTALFEAIVACAGSATEGASTPEITLPPAVQRVIDDVLAQLPPEVECDCIEDGAFVVVHITLPDRFADRLPGGRLPAVRPRGGDLRLFADGRELELRLCKDGRPEAETSVVAASDPWPERGSFAIDCRGLDLGPFEYERWLDRVAKADGRACLLNVPEALEPTTAVWERTHEMPMRRPVGPQLSAELIELWS